VTERKGNAIAAAEFRANPAFEFTVLDRLSVEQRAALGIAEDDPDVYGVLLPRVSSPGRHAKAVDRDTALLFLTLQQPGTLPGYVQASLGEEFEPTVTKLVLDGVLEIHTRDAFVSGPEALEALGVSRPSAVGTSRIARLSHDALVYAQSLEVSEAAALSGRIYAYNRLPVSPAVFIRLPTRAAVARHLGLEDGLSAVIRRRWAGHGARDGPWLAWSTPAPGHGSRGAGTYKLYVSPMLEHLPEALRRSVEVLAGVGAVGLKVGSDLSGILRPDKLIGYFSSFDQLGEAAVELRGHLDGQAAHGVPFTADISPDGLLSWGFDPPPSEQSPGLVGGESWRLWLANRLALALLAARGAAAHGVEPWEYALERIALEGVDPRTWAPREAIWPSIEAPL
jgi:hypothetical protein